MNRKEMSEKLYALSDNEVIKRRKPLRTPFGLTLAGGLMLGANVLLDGGSRSDLKAALILIGGILLAVGTGAILVRLLGSGGIPYCPRTGEYLRYEEFYFPKERMREVMRLCSACDVATLRGMEQTSIPAVVVAAYTTSDERLTACQPFEYVELEYRPLSEMTISRF